MSEFIPVNILIGDRPYRLRIEPSDEEKLRKTIKSINDKIIEFKTNFAGKDMQDFVSMVLIWFVMEQKTEMGNKLLSDGAIEKLNNLEGLIDKALAI